MTTFNYFALFCAFILSNQKVRMMYLRLAAFKDPGWHSRLVRDLGLRGPEFDSRILQPCFDFFHFSVA